jgi:predicted nucleotidyltransferase
MPLRAVYLFGSHVRGEARADSDVDLCVVTDDAEAQIAASRRLSEALLEVWPAIQLGRGAGEGVGAVTV